MCRLFIYTHFAVILLRNQTRAVINVPYDSSSCQEMRNKLQLLMKVKAQCIPFNLLMNRGPLRNAMVHLKEIFLSSINTYTIIITVSFVYQCEIVPVKADKTHIDLLFTTQQQIARLNKLLNKNSACEVSVLPKGLHTVFYP